MYKISEFSKITNLTVKALRYYDEEGLLIPSFRDERTGYRYYDSDDFRKAELLVLLRSLDFSIAEIRDVLANPEDLTDYLDEKKRLILKQMAKEKALIQKIHRHMNPKRQEEKAMHEQIEIKEIPPVTVACIRYRGKYSDTGKYIGRLYKAVKQHGTGAPFQCYNDMEYKEEADILLCIPVSRSVHGTGITTQTLPGIRALSILHKGGYERLNYTYKEILDYAAQQGFTCLTPSREIYHKGPGMVLKGNPDNYVTEILVPLEVKA